MLGGMLCAAYCHKWSNPRCVVPLRKELLSQSEKVYEGVAHRKGHTTTQMSSQQVVN